MKIGDCLICKRSFNATTRDIFIINNRYYIDNIIESEIFSTSDNESYIEISYKINDCYFGQNSLLDSFLTLLESRKLKIENIENIENEK